MNRLSQWISQMRLGMRIFLAVLAGVVALGVTVDWLSVGQRWMLGWDVGVSTYLVLLLQMMVSANSLATEGRSRVGEPNALTILVIVVLTAIASMIATALILAYGKTPNNPQLSLDVGLATWAVLAAWFLTHTSFALQYARYSYSVAFADWCCFTQWFPSSSTVSLSAW
ncbi:DUF1345 domain-containing protein [Thermosynechococcus sp. HN-54]|uniref:DUF1345 domain-containing protein n=1 Tax=Thermosynechococcus sp. HN-54 TaxID=2933959 RepID=UPI00202CBACC|nr:DUF1345 domain-containing protein [Thermosynechococcus sp. HN-54]URR34450.1 DUF1345 domain-containing protein [Thermosynechococcus sp. HN-54]